MNDATLPFDISRLSPAECIALAEQLWDRARSHTQAVPVTPAQLVELHSRLDALDAGEMDQGEPWEDVKSELP